LLVSWRISDESNERWALEFIDQWQRRLATTKTQMQLSPVFKIVRLFMEVSRILYLCFSSTRQLKKKKDKERWIDIEIENTELSALYEH
jgi:hypothetical protein